MSEIIPGAEPLSADGGPVGLLVIHGFTGNPSSMRPIADAAVAAGHSVEMPRLPGHGTTVEDMLSTSWADWSAEVAAAHARLAARTESIVVCGLSMGGTLTAWLGAQHPDIAGLVFINAATAPNPDMRTMVQTMVDAGETLMDGIGSDVADPDVTESAYDKTPLPPLLSLMTALDDLQEGLGRITIPALVLTSPQDHVVDPENARHLVDTLAGPTELVRLERSYHVATIDYDKDLIIDKTLAFVESVTS